MMLEWLPFIMIRALMLTVIIECGTAWLLGVRNKRGQTLVFLANVLTNPPVVSTGAAVIVFAGYDALLPAMLVMELVVVIAESIVYKKRSDDLSETLRCSPIYRSDTMSSSEFVTAETGESTGEMISAQTTDKLNMRCGPGVGFKVLEVVPKNTYVEYDRIFEADGSWMYVTANGKSGWVNGRYLKAAVIDNHDDAEEEIEVSDDSTEKPESQNNTTVVVSKTRKDKLVGMILICIGVAILVSALAFYLLTKNSEKRR